jgi:hypothetical protein
VAVMDAVAASVVDRAWIRADLLLLRVSPPAEIMAVVLGRAKKNALGKSHEIDTKGCILQWSGNEIWVLR